MVATSMVGVFIMGELIVGLVRVLLVRVAVAASLVASLVLSTLPKPTSPLTMPVGVLITGLVKVLLVKVSVVALPTNVSVALGTVIVPVVFKVRVPLPLIKLVAVLPDKVLLVKVAVAAFFVASEVLSTLPRPTSDLVIPVGVLITGEVRVLLVKVSVDEIVGTFTESNSSLSEEFTLRALSALLAAFLQDTDSALAKRATPAAAILVPLDL